jgi:aspartate kinase
MKIFKFGGASIANASCIKNIAALMQDYKSEKTMLVISALGKTTNALEQVAIAYNSNNLVNAKELFSLIEAEHNALAQELMPNETCKNCISDLQNIYAEADWILHDAPTRTADYYYDQIVCLGEMMSTTILSQYFKTQALNNTWIDVRDIIITDDIWQEGMVQIAATEKNILQKIAPLFEKNNIVISQGFIGCTVDNESTTLGREGSDYSAAIFASCLNAHSLTIWKDVPSLLSGDPKIFNNVVALPEISFYEVIEMAYYGAQVIHPKTIKPLQNKNIPLYVKCFLDKNLPGTCINNDTQNRNYPPIFVLKQRQTLLQVSSKDYSFITDDKLSEIYGIFHNLNLHINLMQNAAISFIACINADTEKLNALYNALNADYKILRNDDVQLLTIRHYTPESIASQTNNKTVILEQKSRHTVQFLLK